MLLKFAVENWQSFRDEAEISMIASREKQHQNRLAHIEKYKMRLLPVAAIYGGNASGKTKFFDAIDCLIRLKKCLPNYQKNSLDISLIEDEQIKKAIANAKKRDKHCQDWHRDNHSTVYV